MIFELSKENLELAREEVIRLAETKDFKLYANILISKGNFNYSRLAFTNNVFEEIFISNKIEDVNWAEHYEESFCVRSNISSKEKDLAKLIWDKVSNPKVNLKNPKTEFHFFFVKDKVICGKKVFTRTEKFNLRRPDLRPGFFPVSVKPKLARVLVNLTGVKEGTIWDPFCGTGGIILEGALISLDVIGTDIEEKMIKAAEKNFKKYKVKGKLYVADARKEKVKCNAIVTDPPYGRRASLKKVDIEELYKDFLENVHPFVERVVIMAPNNIKVESSYKKVFETKEYVHSSLTRRIIVLEKLSSVR